MTVPLAKLPPALLCGESTKPAKATVTVTTWRYHLPNVNGEGWAIAFLDSIGCFSCLSDYGDYGYRWPEAGWGDYDFRKFFGREGNADYVLHKIARSDEYDGKTTLRAVKERIIEDRRDSILDREQARHEWDLLEAHDRLYSRENFTFWYQETKIVEAHVLYYTDFSPQVLAFMKHTFPRLQAAIQAELAAEGL